jgi:hypothetical protein
MRRPALAGLFCLLLLALAPADEASEPAYLADWPTAERVLADHQGTDRDDTLARQMAALNQLSLAIDELAGPRRWREGLTPDEQRLRGKEPSHDEQTRVYERLLSNPRLGRLVSREGLDAAQRDLESEDGKLAALAGQLMAATVLRVYAGRDDVELELFDRIARKADRKIGNLRLRGPPRPTRLHPSNPRADDLQRVILLTFTRKLVDPQSDGD